ncbi:MAG: BrnT family toxin [Xanthomonadales bacterium]|nr:BrnT family toxin [Xanthomonadales bacterium]
MKEPHFEWNETKDFMNQKKHGVSFYEAQYAFLDENRIITKDIAHSKDEERFYCFGRDKDGNGILTVRFTFRDETIRIIGAGYWRRGKKIYEKENSLQ